PGSGCGAVTGWPGTRRSARCNGTVSVLVRRPGRKPARASATVRVVKNSREAASAMVLREALFLAETLFLGEMEHAHHRSERDLAEPADRGAAHHLGEITDIAIHLGGTAARAEQTVEDDVCLGRADAARHALAARLVAEEPQDVDCRGEQVGAFGHDNDRAGPQHGT